MSRVRLLVNAATSAAKARRSFVTTRKSKRRFGRAFGRAQGQGSMAPKAAAADDKDPAAAAAAALTVAIENLQSDDPAVRAEALQALASLCASAWGESDVHDKMPVIMPTLLRLLEKDEPALHFAATLAQLPWGTEALLLQ
eukprot:scaffold109353_cov44-Phaeocystis_antarctica.AAC.1